LDVYLLYSGSSFYGSGTTNPANGALNGLTIERVGDSPKVIVSSTKTAYLRYTLGNAHGGTASGGAWYNRPLNTVDDPKVMGVQLDSANSIFTLEAGDYDIAIRAVFCRVNSSMIRVLNEDTGQEVKLSHPIHLHQVGGDVNSGDITLDFNIVLTTRTRCRLQYYVQTTQADYGLGYAFTGSVTSNTYCTVKIVQNASLS
jgi:hypothetical protein